MFRFPVLLALAVIFMPSASHALNEGLQCVPYARALTGVQIRGDAHTWWGQAKGRYQRGSRPKVGAVMSLKPHGRMRLGHVAAVRKIIDNRTILISHANWSTIGGKRGHVEENVKVVDSSANNDWSRVRIWYTPNNALGGSSRPLNGFIYPEKIRSDAKARTSLASLIGPRAKITPVPGGKASVRMASAKPQKTKSQKTKSQKTKSQQKIRPARDIKSFSLSSSTLADVNRKAATESAAKTVAVGQHKMPSTTAQRDDRIADLLGSIGS